MTAFSCKWWVILALTPNFVCAQSVRVGTPAGASLKGSITFVNAQGQTSPIAGVRVLLSGAQVISALSTVTDEEGRYQFAGLAEGEYTIEAGGQNFEPQTANVMIADGSSVSRDFRLRLKAILQTTVVREQAGPIQTESSSSSPTVTDKQLNELPLGKVNHNSYLASPVVPSVVQTPNGVLSIKGASENEGMLLVNSAEAVDPVTGRFVVPVPPEVIDSVSIMETAYDAEYGGFSGGLTEIKTKLPSEQWHFELNDFIPGLRGKNGQLKGIQDETPRAVVTGPLWKQKLNFTAVASFQFDRPPVRGLPWPYNETITRGAGIMTIFQAIFSNKHVMNISTNIFSRHVQFADINALVPQSASSDDGQHGFWLGANDNYELSSGMLLNTVLRYTRVDSYARGQGSAPMLIEPEGWGGNYFDAVTRTGQQVQGFSTLHFPDWKWHGLHEVKIGANLTYRSYGALDQAHPIELLNESGALVEEISFDGFGILHGNDAEFSEFIHDHWAAGDHMAFDVGARIVSQSQGRDLALAPRAAIAYSPGASQATVIRAGAGMFYSRVPLLTTDFADNLTRVVTLYDGRGNVMGPATLYQSTYLQGSDAGFLRSTGRLDRAARNLTWNIEVDHELRHDLQARLNYLVSQTTDLPVVIPLPALPSGGNSALGLSDTGSSHYYGVQGTVQYKPNERQELNISFLHSKARGDLNIPSDVFVPFQQPVIHPNLSGILPSDVPNRFVVWGTFTLPMKLVVAPVADTHTGLPYSVVDAFQNYVGEPNAARFPMYFSLDLQVTRDFPMSALPLLEKAKNRTIRAGIFSFDVTNHRNANAVFNSLASPYFGAFAGFSRRVDGFVFEVH